MKYEVYVETYFSSAHYLKSYKGKCENLHGHNWKIGVIVSAGQLNSQDMVVDFSYLKTILNKIIAKIDHKCLNKLKYFAKNQPTAENIARYIHQELTKILNYKNISSIKVIVWETPYQYASYEK